MTLFYVLFNSVSVISGLLEGDARSMDVCNRSPFMAGKISTSKGC